MSLIARTLIFKQFINLNLTSSVRAQFKAHLKNSIESRPRNRALVRQPVGTAVDDLTPVGTAVGLNFENLA
jgi:hypothetical protein